MCSTHLYELATLNKERALLRASLNVCRQCTAPLPKGRTVLCIRCQPTKDGLTLAQHRDIKSAHKQKLMAQRSTQNTLILAYLNNFLLLHPNPKSSRYASIVRYRINPDSPKDLTLQETGDHFNLTRERVRQIEFLTLHMPLKAFRKSLNVPLEPNP